MVLRRRGLLKTLAGMAALSGFQTRAKAEERPALWVPPEDHPHELTFMQWPVSQVVYKDKYFLELVQQTIADIANAIADFEPVIMLAGANYHTSARKLLSGEIELWEVPTEDLWCRDSGPLFAKTASDELVVSHIQFNGWGGKQVHKYDGLVAERVAEMLDVYVIASGLTGEAGGVEHDGHGLLMAHESSWVDPNRNPGMSRDDIEAKLLQAYGAERMIWAPGLKGEDITDYHIDSLARFAGPGKILINLPDQPDFEDPFEAAAIKTHEVLEQSDVEITVIPDPVYARIRDYGFVASYANYYVCNGAVIMGQFGDKETDRIAVETLKQLYPGREIVALNVDALGEIGGGIHCATQQMPV